MLSCPPRNEIIAHEWSALRVLWDQVKPAGELNEAGNEIERTLAKREGENLSKAFASGAEDWHELNRIEMLIGAQLKGSWLISAYRELLAIAERRKMPGLAEFKKHNTELFADPQPDGDKLVKQRAEHIRLLTTLQSGFINGRYERRLRGETASRLFYFGLSALAIAILPLLLTWMSAVFEQVKPGSPPETGMISREPMFALALATCFGVLGAYFSRLLSFQNAYRTLGFEDAVSLYQTRFLVTRMLYGAIGAFIFYIFLRSKLLGGDAFPDLTRIAITSEAVLVAKDGKLAVVDGKPLLSGLSVLAPTADMAKLLVWSFIAGFSERLVPDTIDRTEARSRPEAKT